MTAPDLAPDFATREAYYLSLFRGTELLRDGDPAEAVPELERAVRLAPDEPTARERLADALVRAGDPARAFAILDELVGRLEGDAHLARARARVLLRLGRATEARAALERVVAARPRDARAWGELARACLRQGTPASREAARAALVRAGHTRLARLLGGVHEERTAPPARDAVPPAPPPAPEAAHRPTILNLAPPPRGASLPPALGGAPSPAALSGAAFAPSAPRLPALTPLRPSGHAPAPLTPALRERATHFPEGVAVGERHATLVATPDRALVLRFDAVRTAAPAFTAELVERRVRGRGNGEPLGGAATPFVRVAGAHRLVLGARPGRSLKGYALEDEACVLREDALVAFDDELTWETLRLTPDGDTLPYVHVRGRGQLVAELPPGFLAVELEPGAPALARRDALLGWRGPVATRTLDPSEAPLGHRGLVVLTGHGHLFVASS